MPCLHLLISGRVQGVWFRESMKREAQRLGVTGWVRNLPDGRVEAVACGSDQTVKAMQEWASKGPPLASVKTVEAREIAAELFASFEKTS
jgi:acylphosphatase